jgi:hypothetical protein
MSNGKGDKPRPVNLKIYGNNFDEIKWGNKPKKIAFHLKKSYNQKQP